MYLAMKNNAPVIDEELIKQIEKEELEATFKKNIAWRISKFLGIQEFQTTDQVQTKESEIIKQNNTFKEFWLNHNRNIMKAFKSENAAHLT